MTNCLLYAVALYLRRFQQGRRQYLQFRKSDMGWFPHFLYAEERRGKIRQVSYKPLTDSFVPRLVFRGRVRWGDDEGHNSH
jgi:hypothetical protein